jgi:hypothetical protein
MGRREFSEGRYDAEQNVLHVWYTQPVQLEDEETIHEFFEDVVERWITPCPRKPYLLVNYANVNIRPDMAEAYAREILRFRDRLLGTFRYGMTQGALGHFTAVAVRLGNLQLAAPSNIFASEGEAREAIRAAGAAPESQPSRSSTRGDRRGP